MIGDVGIPYRGGCSHASKKEKVDLKYNSHLVTVYLKKKKKKKKICPAVQCGGDLHTAQLITINEAFHVQTYCYLLVQK